MHTTNSFLKVKFLFFKRFYLFEREREEREREREREQSTAGGGGEGEADSLLSREPDVGLDPRTLGS